MDSTTEKSHANAAIRCNRDGSANKAYKTVVWLNIFLFAGLAAMCIVAHLALGKFDRPPSRSTLTLA
jgi:hypothetical protein